MKQIAGHSTSVAVWPRLVATEPQRHPSRARHPYVPRGQLRPGGLALWGIQDKPPIRQHSAAQSPPLTVPMQRNWLTIGGLTLASAGAFAIAVPLVNMLVPKASSQNLVAVAPQIADLALSQVPPAEMSAPITPALMPSQPLRQAPLQIMVAAPAPNPFVCPACSGPDPRFAGITIVLRGDDRLQIQSLDQRGLLDAAQVMTAPVGIAVSTAQVRYFRNADRPAAIALADIFSAVLVDVTWLSDAAPAKLELLLPTDEDSG